MRGLDNPNGWPEGYFSLASCSPSSAVSSFTDGGVTARARESWLVSPWASSRDVRTRLGRVRGVCSRGDVEDIAAYAAPASKARAMEQPYLFRTSLSITTTWTVRPPPHIMCLAMQVTSSCGGGAEWCVALDTPRIAVDLDQKKVHVTLEVLRPR